MENGWAEFYITSKVYRTPLEKARLENKKITVGFADLYNTAFPPIGECSNVATEDNRAIEVEFLKKLKH